jgi:hypothetical protein
MKRKLAVLTVLAALVALALPAISSAGMWPAGHEFEIAGGSKLTTSLGSCSLGSITGQIPPAPQNENTTIAVSTPSVGTCSGGASLALVGEWKLQTAGHTVILGGVSPLVTMRFSSLPGCKLTGLGPLVGIWSNGTSTPRLSKSGYHADHGFPGTWANDGGTCALAGTQEAISFEDEQVSGLVSVAIVHVVSDLTSPNTPIIALP